MAATRGRSLGEMGQMFSPYMVSGSVTPPAGGQPFRVRGWGIPTAAAWFDRPGKWNTKLLPEPMKEAHAGG